MSRGSAEIRWAVDVARWRPSGREWAGALSLIAQAKERDKIRRYVFKRDAKASLIGQLMLRKLIREALNIPNTQVNLERTDRGKPYYQGPTALSFRFNVSHQGAYTVLAASPSQLVGIDVMKIDEERFRVPDREAKVADFFHTMRRQFTIGEWANIRGNKGTLEQQLGNFYRHWCLKESYVKAVGVGIGMDLLSLDFGVKEALNGSDILTSTTLSISGQLEKDWRFEEQMLDDKHCVCVALKPAESEPAPFQMLTVEDLSLPVSPSEEHDLWAAEFEAKSEEPIFSSS